MSQNEKHENYIGVDFSGVLCFDAIIFLCTWQWDMFLFQALSGVGETIQIRARILDNTALTTALNTQFLFQIGIFTAVPMVLGFILEQGFLRVNICSPLCFNILFFSPLIYCCSWIKYVSYLWLLCRGSINVDGIWLYAIQYGCVRISSYFQVWSGLVFSSLYSSLVIMENFCVTRHTFFLFPAAGCSQFCNYAVAALFCLLHILSGHTNTLFRPHYSSWWCTGSFSCFFGHLHIPA